MSLALLLESSQMLSPFHEGFQHSSDGGGGGGEGELPHTLETSTSERLEN